MCIRDRYNGIGRIDIVGIDMRGRAQVGGQRAVFGRYARAQLALKARHKAYLAGLVALQMHDKHLIGVGDEGSALEVNACLLYTSRCV